MKKVEFPREIKEKMMAHQEAQGNPRDWKVFKDCISADGRIGGFTWSKTPEGWSFWNDIIEHQDFDLFFKEYPKQESAPEPKYGDRILVRNHPHDKWEPRSFIAFRNKLAVCWAGHKSATGDNGTQYTSSWPLWTTEVALSKQEIADKFGFDVNQIEI